MTAVAEQGDWIGWRDAIPLGTGLLALDYDLLLR